MARWPEPSQKANFARYLADGLYDQAKIKPLEEYLQLQLKEGSYDFLANKTLLKLYLLFPSKVVLENVAAILLKALLNLPANDFTLLLYILPEKVHHDKSILSIMGASESMETARYDAFWSTVNGSAAVFDIVPNWRTEIRKIILEVQAAAHKTVATQWLASAQGLECAELEQFLSGQKSVAKVEGGQVQFSANPQNQPRPRRFKEKVDLMGMLSAINRFAA